MSRGGTAYVQAGGGIVADSDPAAELAETEIKLGALLPLLAARDGAIVPVAQTDGSVPIALWRLMAERALCINTTAAGGNASLMTLEA